MTKYAIIQLAGKQFKVTEGETLVVDRQTGEPGTNLNISDVLVSHDGKAAKIGTPLVSGAEVELKVVSHDLGEKIRVATYKAKSRYRKVRGHRQRQTTLQVVSIRV